MKAEKITPKTVLRGYKPEDALPVFSKNYNDLLDDFIELLEEFIILQSTISPGSNLISNVIPKGNLTGNGLIDGSWAFNGNTLYPINNNSDFGKTGTTINLKGNIVIQSFIMPSPSYNWLITIDDTGEFIKTQL